MKKFLIVMMSVLLMTLAACGSSDEDKGNTNGTTDDNNTGVEDQTGDTNDDAVDEDDDATDDDTVAEDDASDDNDSADTDDADDNESNDSELAEFPEHDIVAEKIDLNKYEADLETDNDNNRVFLYKDEKDEEHYKTIFIKHDKRLKIIEFGKGEIYNEVLK